MDGSRTARGAGAGVVGGRGVAGPVPPQPPWASFPPSIEAVRSARRFVERELAGAGLEHLADDAGLAVAELAGNAVLHARTDFDVTVRVLAAGGARVEVRDGSAAPPVSVAPSATAMRGRGLLMVQTLAAAWGSDGLDGGGKVVWFEVAAAAADVDPDLSVEDLLAAWDDDGPTVEEPGRRPPAGLTDGHRTVVVADLPAVELLAAKEHMDDLLRELQLLLLDVGDQHGGRAPSPRRTTHVVALARRVDTAARAFDGVRRQVREQVSRAVVAGQDRVTVSLDVPPGVVAEALSYRAAIEAAEVLSRAGGLLTTTDGPDGPGGHGEVRRAYLDALITRAGG